MIWLPTPGTHDAIPNADYHADLTAISASPLVTLHRLSPAHMIAERAEPKDSRPLVVGSAMHALLSGDFRADGFEVLPEGKAGASKDAKAITASGGQWLTLAEFSIARGMAQAIDASGVACKLAAGAAQEQSVVWIDEATGLLCKCRPDVWREDIGLVVDYKSIGQRASRKACASAISNYGYHLKAAHYLAGTGAHTFLWIFVEKAAPHGVRLFTASAEMIERGEEQRREALTVWKHCVDMDEWPGYSDGIEDIDLPRWAD